MGDATAVILRQPFLLGKLRLTQFFPAAQEYQSVIQENFCQDFPVIPAIAGGAANRRPAGT
jgi:hypothetical protein